MVAPIQQTTTETFKLLLALALCKGITINQVQHPRDEDESRGRPGLLTAQMGERRIDWCEFKAACARLTTALPAVANAAQAAQATLVRCCAEVEQRRTARMDDLSAILAACGCEPYRAEQSYPCLEDVRCEFRQLRDAYTAVDSAAAKLFDVCGEHGALARAQRPYIEAVLARMSTEEKEEEKKLVASEIHQFMGKRTTDKQDWELAGRVLLALERGRGSA